MKFLNVIFKLLYITCVYCFWLRTAACAAASLAMGILKGEQET